VLNEENETNRLGRPAAVVLPQIPCSPHSRIAFVVLVLLVLRHHQQQQALAALEGGGPAGRRARTRPGGVAQGVAAKAEAGPTARLRWTVASVVSGDIEVRIPALGTVTPLATVTVRPQVSGILTKIAFQEANSSGRPVLAEIDPRPYQAALEQANAICAATRPCGRRQAGLARFEELIKEDSVAQQQLDAQRALVDQDIRHGRIRPATVKTAQINLE